MDDNDEHTMASCIRGYHVYNDIWSPYIGETLTCQRQPLNIKDRYAVSVSKARIVVGHLPKKLFYTLYYYYIAVLLLCNKRKSIPITALLCLAYSNHG